MGKSDPYLLKFYKSFLEDMSFKNVGFFGQSKPNFISRSINATNKFYYDLSLKNWNINNFPYKQNNDEKFDLIVCTRCAYFSKFPDKMIHNFKNLISHNGKIIIDWGLGDHWRFDNFKVGWIKNNEHEWAYENNNFLWSTYLSQKMKKAKSFKQFAYYCRQKGYDNIENAIIHEVPVIINEKDIEKQNLIIEKERSIFLWPQSPQIYTCILLKNKEGSLNE